MVATALPDLDGLDIEALRALVVEQHAQRRQAYSAHLEALSAQGHEIERLRLIIEKLDQVQALAQAAAPTSSPRSCHPHSRARLLPRLRRPVAQLRRGCSRDPGVHPG